MPKYLVVVESPAKAKTISRYLGKDYRVEASVGHVRDLPTKELGIDVEHGFRPVYHVLQDKAKVIHAIQEAGRGADVIYLATDPDREGEAIAWHVTEAAGLDGARLRRITFYQVTKTAVQEAIQNPRGLDRNLIDAQQARRVLDRLVGYEISPLLSQTMRKRLSAGRVQSVALRLVVEREREILAFVPQEYWTLDAELRRRMVAKERFRARLHKISDQDPKLATRQDIDAILPILEKASYTVASVRRGTRQRQPHPPFITSTLQGEAGRKLNLTARQTMRLAQQLYEGIDLNGERVGLITYMRTDSPHVAPEAQQEAQRYIAERWGQDYVPPKPPQYAAKATSLAQEAHEAIRPTSVFRTPEAMDPYLDNRQARLYRLIWQRFVASQMQPARYATMTVDIVAAKDYLFRATGQNLLFAGYLAVYGALEEEENGEAASQTLPPLTEGEALDLLQLFPEQHFTQPPPRYTEPTLIKALEANGVGRPSTYATIISVLQDRGYVYKEDRKLVPTALGMIVCDALTATFTDIMDVSYTATMEEKLDRIAAGQLCYVAMLSEFYDGFQQELASARGAMPTAIEKALWAGLPTSLRNQTCPECGKPLQVRVSKAGRFLGCSGYPECRYILDLEKTPEGEEAQAKEPEFAEGERCELCGGRMRIVTHGRSRFLGCENYPSCKNTRPILSAEIKRLAAETACPACGAQPLEPKKSRYGEYLHCPQCGKNHSLRQLQAGGATTASEMVDLACPSCGHRPIEKRSGRYGPYYRCPACKTNTSERKMAQWIEGGSQSNK